MVAARAPRDGGSVPIDLSPVPGARRASAAGPAPGSADEALLAATAVLAEVRLLHEDPRRVLRSGERELRSLDVARGRLGAVVEAMTAAGGTVTQDDLDVLRDVRDLVGRACDEFVRGPLPRRDDAAARP